MKTSSGIELAVLITLMIAGTGRFPCLQAILIKNLRWKKFLQKLHDCILAIIIGGYQPEWFLRDQWHNFVLDCGTLSEPEVESRDVSINESAIGTRSHHSCSGHLILGIEGMGQYQVSCNVRRLHNSLREVSYLINRGNCCWKVFSSFGFRGQSETVGLGHTGPVQLYKVKSIKKVQCVWKQSK